jgi:hypothetical protein
VELAIGNPLAKSCRVQQLMKGFHISPLDAVSRRYVPVDLSVQ